MNLPLLDTFRPPYEAWETRPPTAEEKITNRCPGDIRVALIARISSARTAADYVAKGVNDSGLSNHIKAALSRSHEYKAWQRAMPSKTPAAISCYQKNYKNSDFAEVANAIDKQGRCLSLGQCLFHGGRWWGDSSLGSTLETTRPLSTSLCPQTGFMNAMHKAKAYDSGRLDLLVLRVTRPTIKAFVFKLKGTKLGHESEVLLASGICLTLKADTLIRSDYPACIDENSRKMIPIHVLEVEIS